MKFKGLKDTHSTDAELAKATSNLREWAKQFSDIPFLSGRLIEDIDVKTSQTTVSHNLGRVPAGYIIVYKSSAGDIWATSKDDTHLVLDTSANVTISIWVF
jgi:hypothetical protein